MDKNFTNNLQLYFRQLDTTKINQTTNQIRQQNEYLNQRQLIKSKIDNYGLPLTEQELFLLYDKTTFFDELENDQNEKQLIQARMGFKKKTLRKNPSKETGPHFLRKSNFLTNIKIKIQSKYEQYKKSREKNKKNKKQAQFFDFLVISPDGYLKLMWDLICMMLIFYEILSIPFKISFDVEISSTFEIVTDVIFLTDILISFNTAYYSNGTLITDHKHIVINYIKLWFWIDLASSFPYSRIIEYAVEVQNEQQSEEEDNSTGKAYSSQLAQSTKLLRFLRFIRFIKVIRLLRLAKLKIIFDKIEEFLQLSSSIAGILSFLKLSIFVLFWAHWLGCIFHFIAQNEDNPNNWLAKAGIEEEVWSVRYTNALYWAVTTMTTVGYGDISPCTPVERAFGLILLLIACGVFAFTMNSIGAALQQINLKKSQYRQKMGDITKYMKKAKIPTELQNRVRRYLEYIWDTERNLKLQDLVKNLSNDLRHTLLLEVNGNMISYCDILFGLFSNQLLLELTQTLSEETIFPQEFVFKEYEEEYQEKNIFFIQSGDVEILYEKTDMILATKSKNDYFGEISFFTNQARCASVKSVNFTDLFFLTREQFLEIVKKFPHDHQKFCMTADEILFQNDYSHINARCYSCNLDDHIAKDCPQLHFSINASHYLNTLQLCMKKQSQSFIRKDRVDYHAWLHIGNVRKAQADMNPKLEKYYMNLLNEEWNINDIEEIDENPEMINKVENVKTTGGIVTQFRVDRSYLKHGNVSLNHRQSLQAQLSDQKKEEIRMSSASSSDGEIDNKVYQKIGDIVQQVEDNAEKRDISETDFYQLMHFESAQEFEYYYPNNNLSVVLGKHNSKMGQGFGQYRQEINLYEMNDLVLKEYVDYYQIDLKEIAIDKYFKANQNITNLDFEAMRIKKMNRRTKKLQKLIQTPAKETFKKQVFKLKVIKILKTLRKARKSLRHLD